MAIKPPLLCHTEFSEQEKHSIFHTRETRGCVLAPVGTAQHTRVVKESKDACRQEFAFKQSNNRGLKQARVEALRGLQQARVEALRGLQQARVEALRGLQPLRGLQQARVACLRPLRCLLVARNSPSTNSKYFCTSRQRLFFCFFVCVKVNTACFSVYRCVSEYSNICAFQFFS